MSIFWKGAAVAALAFTGLAAATPAQAQYYDHRDGYRGGWHGDRGRHWDGDRRWRQERRWDRRHYYRGHRGYYRGRHYGYRQSCWNEWRRGYYGQRVRVRICR